MCFKRKIVYIGIKKLIIITERPPLPPEPKPPALEPPSAPGGLLRQSLTFLQYSSSLSSFGSCIQKNIRLDEDLNFRTKTLPVVHCFTLTNSMSSGKMMRSSSTTPVPRSFHLKCINWSSPCSTWIRPLRRSGDTRLDPKLNLIVI